MPREGESSKKKKKEIFAANQQIHGTCLFFCYIYHLIVIIEEYSAQDVKFNKILNNGILIIPLYFNIP